MMLEKNMRFPFRLVRNLFRVAVLFLLSIPIIGVGGCDSYLVKFYFGDTFSKGSSSAVEKSAEQLAAEGMQKIQKKDYEDAVKDFRQLKERYPYSKYAMLAELKLGDAHFYNGDYTDAAIAYEEFARLHPRNEVIPYVLYQIGMCHFLAFSDIDRDQEETRLAIEAFQRLIQTFPDSEYALKANKQLFECQKRIAAHEFHVGRLYFIMGEYYAARERLEVVNRKYPQAIKDMGYDVELDKMLTASANRVNEGGKKPSFWHRWGF
jgi:outer membrane protein assembly factor BamD